MTVKRDWLLHGDGQKLNQYKIPLNLPRFGFAPAYAQGYGGQAGQAFAENDGIFITLTYVSPLKGERISQFESNYHANLCN